MKKTRRWAGIPMEFEQKIFNLLIEAASLWDELRRVLCGGCVCRFAKAIHLITVY
jgi:hypothetical protein